MKKSGEQIVSFVSKHLTEPHPVTSIIVAGLPCDAVFIWL